MFASGAWEPATSSEFVSRAHLQPKSNGSFRVCLDLRLINSFLASLSSRCETLRRLQTMLEKNDYLFSFDLQDGFHAMAVRPSDRRFLTFQLDGVGFIQLAALPFGLSASPFVFGKLMRLFTTALRAPLAHHRRQEAATAATPPSFRPPRPPSPSVPTTAATTTTTTTASYVPPHRRYAAPPFSTPSSPAQAATILSLLPEFGAVMRRGLRVLPYVDDFLVLCRGPLSAIRSTEQRYVEAVLALLGLRRNCSKGVWSPTQTLEHLGIGIDTVRAVFFVTPRRLQLLSRGATALLCVAARNRSLVPRKQLASFAGLAQSLYLAIPAARHWLRSIHDCVATGGADWSRRVRLSSAARSDLGFFVRLLPQHSSRPIIRSPHTAIIHSDASKTGWGAVLNFRLPARGFWTPSQRRHHITLLEAQAVRLALQAFVDRIRGRRILLHEDNQAVVAMLTSWTSRSPALLQELRKTWRFLDLHDITLDARWIPTADNSLADALSRFRDQLGWRLHPSLSAHLLHRWGPCTRDRFADAQHHLLPVYDSLCVDPAAAGVDAFAQEDWKAFTNYCNPPFSELSRLAQLLRDTGAAAVVVAPFWPAQPWFQALSELAADSMLLPAHLCSLSPEPSPSSAPTARASWRGIAFAIPAAPLASALPPSPPSLPRYQHRGGEYRHCRRGRAAQRRLTPRAVLTLPPS